MRFDRLIGVDLGFFGNKKDKSKKNPEKIQVPPADKSPKNDEDNQSTPKGDDDKDDESRGLDSNEFFMKTAPNTRVDPNEYSPPDLFAGMSMSMGPPKQAPLPQPTAAPVENMFGGMNLNFGSFTPAPPPPTNQPIFPGT